MDDLPVLAQFKRGPILFSLSLAVVQQCNVGPVSGFSSNRKGLLREGFLVELPEAIAVFFLILRALTEMDGGCHGS